MIGLLVAGTIHVIWGWYPLLQYPVPSVPSIFVALALIELIRYRPRKGPVTYGDVFNSVVGRVLMASMTLLSVALMRWVCS